MKEGRKEGTCLFDINNHNTEYTSVKILSGDSHKGTVCAAIAGATHVSQYLNILCKKMIQIIKHESC